MPTYKKADVEVQQLADKIMAEFCTHRPLIDAKVRIDFVFAYPDYDEKTGLPKNCALKLHGVQALGIAKKITLKDRAQGRGDAEIALDGDWWNSANEKERAALLDHELHHLEPREDERGYVLDDLHRPTLRLRKHDFQFGWFNIIAHRHGEMSQECQQARQLMDKAGQLYWPALTKTERPARKLRAVEAAPAQAAA